MYDTDSNCSDYMRQDGIRSHGPVTKIQKADMGFVIREKTNKQKVI